MAVAACAIGARGRNCGISAIATSDRTALVMTLSKLMTTILPHFRRSVKFSRKKRVELAKLTTGLNSP